eukprot:Hpha_TRINITY_DN16146_c1_g9::TRINITY_DN16146_c1_g9_i1::g.3826::m.3826
MRCGDTPLSRGGKALRLGGKTPRTEPPTRTPGGAGGGGVTVPGECKMRGRIRTGEASQKLDFVEGEGTSERLGEEMGGGERGPYYHGIAHPKPHPPPPHLPTLMV